MPLNNKQKIAILRAAKDEGYTGDVTEFFKQAENEGIFTESPEPTSPKVSNVSMDDLNFAEADDFKFNPKSLLVDKTPHRFNDNDNFITSSHTTEPNSKAILRFLNDPNYTPTAEPSMGADGGFEKQFNTNYQESQNYQRIKGSRKGVRQNPDGSHSTHLMADNNKDEAWPTLFQNEDGTWFEGGYKEAKERGEIYKFDSKEELINFARKGDWKEKGGFKKYPGGGWKAPDEIFPGAPPEFVVSWGNQSMDPNKQSGDKFSWGLSSGTWKYLGNEAYKWGTGAVRKWGEEIENFGQTALTEGKEWVGDKLGSLGDIIGLEEGGFKYGDGDKRKYHEGGPNEGPHPEHHIGTNDNISTTLEIQTAIGTTPDGDWGDNTTKKMLAYSNKNLNNLEVYNKDWKTEHIRCSGRSCSEMTTNMMQLLYPHLSQNDLVADDSWYRRSHLLGDGGQDIWSQRTDVEWNNMASIPPVETWKNLQIGDIVHLNAGGKDSPNFKKESAYGEGHINRGTGHTGFIIGKDPKTGMPLVMHGYNHKMEVDPINNIRLDSAGGNVNAVETRGGYKIDGITRPKKLINKNDYNFKNLSFFLDKSEIDERIQIGFDEDYLNTLDTEDRKNANFFQTWANGGYGYKAVDDMNLKEWNARLDESPEAINEDLNYNYLTKMEDVREFDLIDEATPPITPIETISKITGYKEDVVAKAAMMTWGFYQNETGETGLGSGAQMGKLAEFTKDNFSTKNAARLKALKNKDINWNNFWWNINPVTWINEEDYMRSAAQEPSRGILRIKYNLNEIRADEKPSIVGQWWEKYGLKGPDQLTLEDDKENTLITGQPGRAGMANSFGAATMLTLSYYENIRRRPGYDSETDTYKGIPIDYVVATMHTGQNLNVTAGNGKTVLENLRASDRDYSNITINSANKLGYTKTQLSINPETRKLDEKILIDSETPFKEANDFMNNK